ncbi:MAG: carbohydrate ABC transporter permease [Lachnospiraceae bacterium]|nr:carbohydrate ABC transporter permease [Lachnospiraceae bacterium]
MRHVWKTLRMLLIVCICFISLVPFYILLVLSLNSPSRNFYEGNMFVPDFSLANYREGWEKASIGRAMINSGWITIIALLIIVVFGAMAGYAIGRYRNKFNLIGYYIMIGCMMIPAIIITVPLYSLMIKLHAINTLWGMGCVCAVSALPQAIFIFTGFVRQLPVEIEEAAIIDGCSKWKCFWKIVFPLLKPSISAVIILNGFGIWNNYAQAVFFLQDPKMHNVPLALSVYFQQFAGAHWNLMAATAVIAIIPVLVVFLIFQKNLMSGLTDGAVKG